MRPEGGDVTSPEWDYFFPGKQKGTDVNYRSYTNPYIDTIGWYAYNNITGTTTAEKQSETVGGFGTHQVGKKLPNKLGLYDMGGNVAEWCYDIFADETGKGSVVNPIQCEGIKLDEYRTLRGGGWNLDGYYCAVTRRHMHKPSYKDSAVGFRIARNAN